MKSGFAVDYIRVYLQFQSIKETQIVGWDNSRPVVTSNGTEIYRDRLKPNFDNGKLFTLKIINATYNDAGKYVVKALSFMEENYSRTNHDVTLNVHGMFFCNC